MTDALDAQHLAVEEWARKEGMVVREKVQKEKQQDDLGVRTDYHNMELGNPDAGVPSTFAEVQGNTVFCHRRCFRFGTKSRTIYE